jgi:hypothetical protein
LLQKQAVLCSIGFVKVTRRGLSNWQYNGHAFQQHGHVFFSACQDNRKSVPLILRLSYNIVRLPFASWSQVDPDSCFAEICPALVSQRFQRGVQRTSCNHGGLLKLRLICCCSATVRSSCDHPSSIVPLSPERTVWRPNVAYHRIHV